MQHNYDDYSKYVIPPHPYDSGHQKKSKAEELFEGIIHAALTPVRLIIIAYTHVLTGKKVERPYQWSEI